MIDYTRIQKDCFWDLYISKKDIDTILERDDMRKKKMLFEKILLNSTKLFTDLKIFDSEQLAWLLEDYNTPKFNQEYAFRRKNMAEVYFFNKPLLIDDLKWVA
ncbi:hypothetical protein [Sulfurimonas sp.]|jgi:hypothetical protein|uniref:hypothetical protein n=1 Tax=Sulfurimonas sp. TaxID=2022749 RepID=UPI0025E202C7|nr:hypothetical protein [Sulfurimonas sp.]MBT5935154.1 hypothetical protein [Sulfurimonas sp.]